MTEYTLLFVSSCKQDMASLAFLSPSSFSSPILPAPRRLAPPRRITCLAFGEHESTLPVQRISQKGWMRGLKNTVQLKSQHHFQSFLDSATLGILGWNQDVEDTKETQRLISLTTVGMTFLMVDSLALAVETGKVDEDYHGYTDEQWVWLWITWAIAAFLYFIVIPLIVYTYLQLRWYKRKFLEAFIQFGLVFLFFPGMLLMAPFINFRQLPRNGAKEPWDDVRPR